MKQPDKKTQDKIQELQILEQSFQNLTMQKQTFQLELTEIENALSEMEKSDEVYELTGNILIKSDIKELKNKLKEKKEIAELRIKTLEKQETSIQQKIQDLQKQIMENIK